MQPIKFISPSSFFYWTKCPLKAVYSKSFRDQQIFPKHPDADLGSIIHSFIENKAKWNISSSVAFEEKWEIEIDKLDYTYKKSGVQKIYFPIKWNAKYFAVKKLLLKKSLLREISRPKINHLSRSKFEQWIDDSKDIGGKVDYMILNENDEIVEIVDFKTGNIFEFTGTNKSIKMAYIYQLLLYAYIINEKQMFYPRCFIQDIKGNKYEVEISEEAINEIYKSVIELKTQINQSIEDGDVDQLANPNIKNCSYCDYRPLCNQYKTTLINNFDNKQVDIYGEVISLKGSEKLELKIKVENKILTLKNISTYESIQMGDNIFVYNLFCPDGDTEILFAMKQTVIKHDSNTNCVIPQG